ncbi:sirohydrochlorin cobaltochelatase [Desulfovibrio sp. OttesenSCG-928-C14]|nr:sirohydrochlorin cobaltochelatase [Desulfovibrio sp. OttesenSCG-928-C14]
MTQSAKKAILLAAYGATGIQNHQNLQAFERKVREVFPEDSIRWAFTSVLMRSRLAAARKKTDSVQKALCRLGFEKYSQVTVQSLHIVPGREYQDMLEEISQAASCGAPANISVGLPLLSEAGDVDKAASAVLASLPEARRRDEAVVWAGHGGWHTGNSAYAELAAQVRARDDKIVMGNLSGENSVEQVLERLEQCGAKTVWLLPLLSVIGKHAAQDLAGEGKDSWKSILESRGYDCRPVLRGVIEYEGFMDIWLEHLKRAAG